MIETYDTWIRLTLTFGVPLYGQFLQIRLGSLTIRILKHANPTDPNQGPKTDETPMRSNTDTTLTSDSQFQEINE